MPRIGIIFIILLTVLMTLSAQEETAEVDASNREDSFPVRVLYESAFVRVLPDEEADPAASVFENDVLQAIGRNADGSWLEVRRPGRDVSLGWMAKWLIVYSFDITALPITDFTTGLIGDEPVFDSGVSLVILTESNLRSQPYFDSDIVGIAPSSVTIPAIERNIDDRWVKVNYLGIVGWVSSFSFVNSTDLSSLPISAETAPNTIAVAIIPPEIQLAQIARMRAYLTPIQQTANEMVAFWGALQDGQVMPCYPPEGNFTMIEITTQDLYELPELRTAARRLQRGIEDLNATIEAMRRCGVYTPRELSNFNADAVNAQIIINVVLSRMDIAEEIVLEQAGRSD